MLCPTVSKTPPRPPAGAAKSRYRRSNQPRGQPRHPERGRVQRPWQDGLPGRATTRDGWTLTITLSQPRAREAFCNFG
jgi:hypothetical protein